MKKLQMFVIGAAALVCAGALTACGNDKNNTPTENPGNLNAATTENANDKTNAPDNRGNAGNSKVDGMRENQGAAGEAADDLGDAGKNIVDGVGDAGKDLVDGVGEAGKDIIDGAEELGDDITRGTRQNNGENTTGTGAEDPGVNP